MEIQFKSADEMAAMVHDNHDFYNEDTGIYVFRYNEKGSICYYRLSKQQAQNIAKELKGSGEHYWASLLGPGGYILDDPQVIHGFFRDNWEGTWYVADENYCQLNEYYILKAGNFPDEKTYPENYETYAKAYQAAHDLYDKEMRTGKPSRWGIYKVTIYNHAESNNKFTRAVWE